MNILNTNQLGNWEKSMENSSGQKFFRESKKDKDQELYADSAYTGEKQEETIAKYKMINKVHEKGYKNKPLTEEQKENNTEKSRTRARVEHVFGFMKQSMNDLKLKLIGIARATGIIGLINLTNNLFRYEQVVRLKILPKKKLRIIEIVT